MAGVSPGTMMDVVILAEMLVTCRNFSNKRELGNRRHTTSCDCSEAEMDDRERSEVMYRVTFEDSDGRQERVVSINSPLTDTDEIQSSESFRARS